MWFEINKRNLDLKNNLKKKLSGDTKTRMLETSFYFTMFPRSSIASESYMKKLGFP